MHQDFPKTTVEACTMNFIGFRNSMTVHNGRQGSNGSRGLAMKLLQERHMEHIVDARPGRKLETIGNRANALNHLKGPVLARSQLGILGILDGRRRALVKTKPYPVTHSKSDIPMCRIMLLLHNALRLEEPILNNSQEHIPLDELFVQGGHS